MIPLFAPKSQGFLAYKSCKACKEAHKKTLSKGKCAQSKQLLIKKAK